MKPASTPRSSCTRTLPCLLAATALLGACGGGGGGGGGTTGSGPGTPPPAAQWQSRLVHQVNAGGLTTPRLDTAVAADGQAHLFFFEDSGDPQAPYAIRHLIVDPQTAATAAATGASITQVDNCGGLSAAVRAGTEPLVLYQGGVEKACGAPLQADAMVSLEEAGGWQEYTAAIGDVPPERNPVFLDGLAGTSMATATDSAGRIHAVFQFYWEGCDGMNFGYPDLRYVSAEPAELSAQAGLAEETVEGNDYIALGGSNEQNRVGDQVCLAVDGNDRPVTFYSATLADGTQGLRTARREGTGWVHEWVETECEVGAVSCATSPADGSVAVAYQVLGYTDGLRDDVECLRFAERGAGGWEPRMVDDRSRCGHDCSLAFDAAGNPAIAYRSALSHTLRDLDDLKLARRAAGIWSDEEVATTGDLGHSNRLWIAGTTTHISTYSASQRAIYLLSR